MTVFTPGNKYGKGRPKLDPYLVEVKKMNRDEVERLLADFMKSDRSKIKEAIENPNTPMINLMVASLIQKAITTGDPSILNFLLDRTIGKVKENVEIDISVREREFRHRDALALIPREKIIELIQVKPPND